MKKSIVIAALLFAVSLFAASPIFIGATSDYITNGAGQITFVYSNRVRVIYERGSSRMWFTNGISANTLWTTHGQINEGGSILSDYAFGTRGSLWQFLFGTNQASLAESSGNSIWNYTRTSGVLQFAGTGGIKVEGSSVNFTNLPGVGEFVAITSSGLLYRTNTPAGTNINNNYFQTNTYYNQTTFKGPTTFTSVSNYFNQIIVTNGVGDAISTATRYGGALTNISLDAQAAAVIHVDGSTNVNIVAIMNWIAGLQRPITLLITNRTATVRTVSLETTTNNWLGMGTVTAPWQITNALWIAFENLGTSNNVYAAQYISNPSN